jgi:hypothetical protein
MSRKATRAERKAIESSIEKYGSSCWTPLTKPKNAKQKRSAVIVISDWLLNCRNDQWTPFEAASNLKHTLQKEGYVIVPAKVIEGLGRMPR